MVKHHAGFSENTLRPLVSLIIPVYKVEKLLPRCLDSVIAQDYRPLEVILVNDGSPDRCGEIMEEYRRRYPGLFICIEKENQGLGPARNTGIEAARGEWLCFIDSDDYVEPDYVSVLLKTALEEAADVGVSSFYLEKENGRRFPFPFMRRRTLSGDRAARESLNMLTLPTYVWNKIYKSSLFKEGGIRFPALYYEDLAVASPLFYRTDKVAACPEPLYHYVSRGESIVGHFTEKNIHDYLAVVQSLADFIAEKGLWPEWKRAFGLLIFNSKLNLPLQILPMAGGGSLKERFGRLGEVYRTLNRIRRALRESQEG